MSASIRIVLMASLALGCMPAHAQSPDRCPGDVDTVVAFERDGALMARFFFVEDPDGYKIEVLQRHGRYQ